MSTYTPIATFKTTALTSVITFTSIPQNYTDLIITGFAKRDTGSELDMLVRYNNDSSSSYSRIYLWSNGTTAGSGKEADQTSARLVYANNVNWSTPHIQIMNYSGTYNYKTAIQRQVLPGIVTAINAATWRKTNAIDTITLTTAADNWAIGTTFNLYGIESGTVKAQGGNLVTTDGTYWYHTFTTSGTFTPLQNITADFLVIAGGGGGSVSNVGGLGMGGGGAGGYRTSVGTSGGGSSAESSLSLSSNTNYTVTVGAGGIGGQENDSDGNATNGSNSVFASITSIGGGRGGNQNGGPAVGGSGGGAQGAAAGVSPAQGTAGQGYAGGAGGASNVGGGGGGAGAVGQAGDAAGSGKAGAGGAGIASSISGTSVTRGGGGGGSANDQTAGAAGGAGGTGGGGAGTASNANGGSGTANTGGGGGASGNTATPATAGKGGNGGSGIVIVRYSV